MSHLPLSLDAVPPSPPVSTATPVTPAKMDQLPPSEQIEDGDGGKAQIRERKPSSNLQSKAICDVSDVGSVSSSHKVHYSARPSLASLLLWLVPQYLKDPGCESDDDSPLGWATPFVNFSLAIVLAYLMLLVLHRLFIHESIAILSWVATIILIPLLVCIRFLSETESISLLEICMVSVPCIAVCTGSFLGMLSMYLNTIYASWVCGCKIAKLRLCRGVEKSAEIAFSCSKIQMQTVDPIPPFFMVCVLSLTCAVRVVFMCRMPPKDPISAITDISFMVTICMFAWTCKCCTSQWCTLQGAGYWHRFCERIHSSIYADVSGCYLVW